MPPSAALKVRAGYSAFHYYREELRRVPPFRRQVSFLLSSVIYRPARLTVNFACWAAIIEMQGGAENMKYETLCFLEAARGVYTEFRTGLVKISRTT